MLFKQKCVKIKIKDKNIISDLHYLSKGCNIFRCFCLFCSPRLH